MELMGLIKLRLLDLGIDNLKHLNLVSKVTSFSFGDFSIENMRLDPYNFSKRNLDLANTEKNQWYIKPIVLYKIISPK
jgi:hypothetical protein